jgi:hypothetical protein
MLMESDVNLPTLLAGEAATPVVAERSQFHGESAEVSNPMLIVMIHDMPRQA